MEFKTSLRALLFFVGFSSLAAQSSAQYYYKDIISNNQLRTEMATYKSNSVRNIRIKTFEDDGSESEGFFCEKKLSKDYRKSDLFTRAAMAPASLFLSAFDTEGKLLSTTDSSSLSVTKIRYTYDDKSRISNIVSVIRSEDEDFVNEVTETHIYRYDETGLPTSMLRITKGRDTTEILFAADDAGNIAVEKDTKSAAKYFYYYDNKKRLTDIVHGNEMTTRLKPDYMFEYNGGGLITQMTTVEEGSSNYFVWKYNYENGLRVKERCFTNERRLMGSVEYEYK